MKAAAPQSEKSARPLEGYRVLITRASRQSDGLARPLRDLGAQVTEIPTIEICPPRTFKPLDSALKNSDRYDWLVLTSVNGVEALFARLERADLPVSKLMHLQIAAIGPATRREIEKHGLQVSVTPEKYIAESVVEALREKTRGKRVLLVRARVARDVLPNELRKTAASVEIIEAYETKVPTGAKQKLNQLFANRDTQPQIVTFTSSSTATNFFSLLEKEHWEALREMWLASIGPVTSATLKDAGFRPTIEATEYTTTGLARAIEQHVAGRKHHS